MYAFAPTSLQPARTFVYHHYSALRRRLQRLRLMAGTIREARRRRRQERHDERMRSFYSWCEACRGLGSIF
ncbi:hypothetical protein [Hymenobacter actinosclerus]|uniref:Uncharacterized protein n=1 Tax=Hymenobacter actinosclerus TaxID=82805 RepID=A0A1I0FB03_9BACT|nr:hypothetical protein [Hymenobacter actinosclerus]SET55219.1 hypothetical protein SAMN04487998_2191 [Hymenobacter actinosclerus]